MLMTASRSRAGRRIVLLCAATLVALAVWGCGDDDGGGDSAANTATPAPVEATVLPPVVSTPAPPEVRVADIAGRRILTDVAGFTLYTFTEDNAEDGTSACNGACRQAWPPFVIEGTAVTAPPDITGQFATIVRLDDTSQVTYNGKPLYRFQQDAAPGELKGDDFGGAWFAAQP
jgi:predicted lipoprotein with Yx(FWY)xxD motif